MVRQTKNKTPYELWFRRKATVKHFKIFGNKCYINRTKTNLDKFEDRGNDVIFKKHGCEVRRANNGKIVSHGTRTSSNLCTLE